MQICNFFVCKTFFMPIASPPPLPACPIFKIYKLILVKGGGGHETYNSPENLNSVQT